MQLSIVGKVCSRVVDLILASPSKLTWNILWNKGAAMASPYPAVLVRSIPRFSPDQQVFRNSSEFRVPPPPPTTTATLHYLALPGRRNRRGVDSCKQTLLQRRPPAYLDRRTGPASSPRALAGGDKPSAAGANGRPPAAATDAESRRPKSGGPGRN